MRMRASNRVAGNVSVIILAALLAAPAHGAILVVYDNTGNPANDYYAGQAGEEAIDDLHAIQSGTLTECAFEYFAPVGTGTFSATVTLYDNPGGFDAAIAPVAGPFVVTGLGEGRELVTIPIPAGPNVVAHLWVGVRFSSTRPGLIRKDVPATGSSHDFYLENGGFYFFGGAPLANFALRVKVDHVPTGVGDPLARGFSLSPIRPSPFQESATIAYTLGHGGRVRLDVLDVRGRRVTTLADGWRDAGEHRASWEGRDAAGHRVDAGLYFVRLAWPGGVATCKVAFTP